MSRPGPDLWLLARFEDQGEELERRLGLGSAPAADHPGRAPSAGGEWLLGFECGLRLRLTRDSRCAARRGWSVEGNLPEPRHALDHLGVPSSAVIWRADPPGERGAPGGARIELWRLDDNGNQLRVDVLASESTAACLLARYEARGHKQTYWLERP